MLERAGARWWGWDSATPPKAFVMGLGQCEEPRNGIGGCVPTGQRPRSGKSPGGRKITCRPRAGTTSPGTLPLLFQSVTMQFSCSVCALKPPTCLSPTAHGTHAPTTLYASAGPHHSTDILSNACVTRCHALATSRRAAEGTLQGHVRARMPACLHRTKQTGFGLQSVEGCIVGCPGQPDDHAVQQAAEGSAHC